MKPYLRNKNIKGAGKWKKDYHIRWNNKKQENWWEDLNNLTSRRTEKQKLNKEIEKSLNFFCKNIWLF